MNALDALLSSVGDWQGVNRLWTTPDQPPIESASATNVTAVLGGRFVRLDQSWSYDGEPQSGAILVGHDRNAKVYSVHWIDTFHMGCKVMACAGVVPDAGVIQVRGTYAAPPGPDWGWRIQIEAELQAGLLVLLMYNVHPDGKEDLAVQATHRRSTAV